MTLNYHSKFCPKNDVIFAILFGQRILFCPLVSAVTGDTIDLDGEPHTQAEVREDSVLLESIRFDTFAKTVDNKFYSADAQREYKEARLFRRTVFYACRAVSRQNVDRMAYEDLKPVNISFIFTDRDEHRPIRHIKLLDEETYEIFDDLITITLVYVQAVLRTGDKASDLYIFARFFAISSQEEGDQFAADYGSTELGKVLIRLYNTAVADEKKLYEIEKSEYFKERLNEAQLEEERNIALMKGEMKAKKTAVISMLKRFTVDEVAEELDVPVIQVLAWQKEAQK